MPTTDMEPTPAPLRQNRQTLLMCPPDFFGVDYVINPWMHGHVGLSNHAEALAQWNALHALLKPHAEVALVPPQPGLPDLVFTANAGLVWGQQVIISRFHAPERQGEAPHDAAWFQQNGFEVVSHWPEELSFEGAGDALFDRASPHKLWLGHGFRSDVRGAPLLARLTGREVVPLRLVNAHFYHLDTCFCPLSCGAVLYYPPAFDAESQAVIEAHVPESQRIVVGDEDARAFVCNAVEVDAHLILNKASPTLQDRIHARGLTPLITPLTEFMKAGGSAKCLTLKLCEPA